MTKPIIVLAALKGVAEGQSLRAEERSLQNGACGDKALIAFIASGATMDIPSPGTCRTEAGKQLCVTKCKLRHTTSDSEVGAKCGDAGPELVGKCTPAQVTDEDVDRYCNDKEQGPCKCSSSRGQLLEGLPQDDPGTDCADDELCLFPMFSLGESRCERIRRVATTPTPTIKAAAVDCSGIRTEGDCISPPCSWIKPKAWETKGYCIRSGRVWR